MADVKELDLSRDPDAKPTSHLPSPAAVPVTPGVSRPDHPREPDPLSRRITRALALKIMRYFGLTDYDADVAERVIPVVLLEDLSKQQAPEETRTGADYRIVTIDLSATGGFVGSRVPIQSVKDFVMSSVALISLTAGATFSLHVGERDPIPFGSVGLGVGTSLLMDPPEQIGLSITNPVAQPAAQAILLVSSGVRVNF